MLDHKAQKMRVFHKNAEISSTFDGSTKTDGEFIVIPYKNILQVDKPPEQEERKKNTVVRHRWSFEFTIHCKERDYRVLAASDDERELWVFAFNWIIAESERLRKKREDI